MRVFVYSRELPKVSKTVHCYATHAGSVLEQSPDFSTLLDLAQHIRGSMNGRRDELLDIVYSIPPDLERSWADARAYWQDKCDPITWRYVALSPVDQTELRLLLRYRSCDNRVPKL